MQEYYDNTKGVTSLLNVENPIYGKLISAAHSSFVDDVCSTAASYDNELLADTAKTMSDELTTSFEKGGFKQNCSKATMLAKAFGQGAHLAMRQIEQKHAGLNSQCRYLGPQLHWSGSNM